MSFLEHLDASYPGVPREVGAFFAVTRADRVTLSWTPGTVSPGQRYRVYRDARFLSETTGLTLPDRAAPGVTYVYGIRVADAAGYLSAVRTIRVLVGTGVVDEQGATVRDTFPPSRVTGLRATRAGTVESSSPEGVRLYFISSLFEAFFSMSLQNISTSSGSNCVPAQRLSSSMAYSDDSCSR